MASRRRRKSELEETVEALSRLSWPTCVALALVTYLAFHWLAQIQPPPAQDTAQLGNTFAVTLFRTVGAFLQYLAPICLLLAGLISWVSKRRRTRLLLETETRTSTAPLHELSWREFEQLVGAHFERLGFTVSFTPEGADGGVDVVARKGRETFLVQCKQWRATQIGVTVVRELFGVMAARGATGAYVVSIGKFTSDASDFAEGRNIELVDATTLLRSRTAMNAVGAPATTPNQPASAPRACPSCGAPMVRRTAKQGATKGQPFWGCSTFPRCRGTLPDA